MSRTRGRLATASPPSPRANPLKRAVCARGPREALGPVDSPAPMPKRAAKLANSVATTVGVRWSELLPEMWAEIWKWVLCDKVGNVTVPGLVYECHNWRLVCKQFRTLSQTTPTPYDATIWFSGVNQPALFKGGLAYGKERRCRLLRHARSGQVFFVTCMPDADRKGYQQTLKKWSLPDLVACLGVHNADFKTRLRDLGRIVRLLVVFRQLILDFLERLSRHAGGLVSR